MLGLRIRSFFLPKEGKTLEEYEDAWAYDEQAGRFSVADGATEGFECRLWARSLVQAFIQKPPQHAAAALQEWLSDPIRVWHKQIPWGDLTYFQERAALGGAYATLLGVNFIGPRVGRSRWVQPPASWQAVAVGDACLFHVSDGRLAMTFPMSRAEDFGTTPDLLATRAHYNLTSVNFAKFMSGDLHADDVLLLTTDALGEWFLGQVESGAEPWNILEQLTPDSFGPFVTDQRQIGSMRNDDVTLLLLRYDDNSHDSSDVGMMK